MSQTSDAGAFRLFDTDGIEVAQIETNGSTLKPFLNAVRQVVGECRIHFTEDGLRVSAVDPANVFMIRAELPASAFDTYNLPNDEGEIGVDVASFRYAIRRARMNSDDTLELQINDRRLYASIGREYDDGTQVTTEDYVDLIDPDSVRMEPDIPDLDLTPLDVSQEAFVETTEYADASFTDYLKYEVADGDLLVAAKGDAASSKARIKDVTDPDASLGALYSTDYLSDALAAVRKAKADSLTVELGDEFPITLGFERTNDDDDVILSGALLLAPRVQSGGPGGDE